MFPLKKLLLSLSVLTYCIPSEASLRVICGSMASGKSDEFIRSSRRRMVANPNEVGIFKHGWDNRILNDNNVSEL